MLLELLACVRTIPPVAQPPAVTLQARLKVQVEAAGMSISFPGVLVLDGEDRGHLAALGPLGAPVVTVTGVGDAVAIRDVRQRIVYIGASADDVLATVLGLGVEDLWDLFRGDVADWGRWQPADPTLGTLRMERKGVDGDRYEVLSESNGRPIRVEWVDAQGTVEGELRWTGFVTAPDGVGAVPDGWVWSWPARGVHIEIVAESWRRPDPNPSIFDLVPPQGFEVRPLEALPLGAFTP